MIAQPAPTMPNVFDDDGRYLGVVFARGRSGFEAFEANERTLGLFPTAKRAEGALLISADHFNEKNRAAFEREPGSKDFHDEKAYTRIEP
jgi:hypothetical protein